MIAFLKMDKSKKSEDLSDKIQIALDKVIEETKAKNAYFIYSDKKGNIIKVPAKDSNFFFIVFFLYLYSHLFLTYSQYVKVT